MIHSKFYNVRLSDLDRRFGCVGSFQIVYRSGAIVNVEGCALSPLMAEIQCSNYCHRPDVECVSFFSSEGVQWASAVVVNSKS